MRMRRLLVLFVAACGALAVALVLWDPAPETEQRFDRQQNGVWLGHKWYTGRHVRTGESVSANELAQLERNLNRHGIHDLFVHVGPSQEDGSIADQPGRIFFSLRKTFTGARVLAWLGARVETISLASPAFQEKLIDSLKELREAGFDGVHFDFEPMADHEPGYLELLSRVRMKMGPDFMISQATPRASLMGLPPGPLRRSFWSEKFYRATMQRSDQTVLMAYDSRFDYISAYLFFVSHQTGLLADWACSITGHELLIGIPSYEDVPVYSNPNVENIRTASLGVRSALEDRESPTPCLLGVSVYSNWVTDEEEWADFRRYWMEPAETLSE